MRSKQTGVTLIGWIVLLIPVAICAYAGMRLTPVYLNYQKVTKALDVVQSQFKDGTVNSQQEIRKVLERNLGIQSVDYPNEKDFKITKDGRQWVVSIAYDDQAPLFSNVFILVSFDKTVRLGSEKSVE